MQRAENPYKKSKTREWPDFNPQTLTLPSPTISTPTTGIPKLVDPDDRHSELVDLDDFPVPDLAHHGPQRVHADAAFLRDSAGGQGEIHPDCEEGRQPSVGQRPDDLDRHPQPFTSTTTTSSTLTTSPLTIATGIPSSFDLDHRFVLHAHDAAADDLVWHLQLVDLDHYFIHGGGERQRLFPEDAVRLDSRVR